MPYQTLEVERPSRRIVDIWLNRPQVRNAFDEHVIAELTACCEEAEKDSELRLMRLRGRGKAFCAGGDINWMRQSADMDFDGNLQDTLKLARLFDRLNRFPRPILGGIHGAAIGGGVGLVSICDVAVCVSTTVFSLSEVKLGLVPACIGPFVISKIGPSHARRYFVSGERFTADEALRIGLVHQVVKNEEELAKELAAHTERFLACGPVAVKEAKSLVLDLSWPERRAQQEDVLSFIAETLARLRTSPEGQEGVTAFLDKREPAWRKN